MFCFVRTGSNCTFNPRLCSPIWSFVCVCALLPILRDKINGEFHVPTFDFELKHLLWRIQTCGLLNYVAAFLVSDKRFLIGGDANWQAGHVSFWLRNAEPNAVYYKVAGCPRIGWSNRSIPLDECPCSLELIDFIPVLFRAQGFDDVKEFLVVNLNFKMKFQVRSKFIVHRVYLNQSN